MNKKRSIEVTILGWMAIVGHSLAIPLVYFDVTYNYNNIILKSFLVTVGANPKMTQRYAHLRNDQLSDAIKKLDNSDKADLQLADIVYNTFLENSTNLAHRLN